MKPGSNLCAYDFKEKSLFYNMLILKTTIGVASMEVQGVGSLPSQIHFFLYIVLSWLDFFNTYSF